MSSTSCRIFSGTPRNLYDSSDFKHFIIVSSCSNISSWDKSILPLLIIIALHFLAFYSTPPSDIFLFISESMLIMFVKKRVCYLGAD